MWIEHGSRIPSIGEMMRYLIVDEDYGVFLGSRLLSGSISDDDSEIAIIFSKTSPYVVRKAVSFEKISDAERYIEFLELGNPDYESLSVIEVEGDERYVDIIDIVKEGYGEYVKDMVDCMPMQSIEIH